MARDVWRFVLLPVGLAVATSCASPGVCPTKRTHCPPFGYVEPEPLSLNSSKPRSTEVPKPLNLDGPLPLSLDGPGHRSERIVVARTPLKAGTRLRTSLLRAVARPSGLKWAGHLRPVDLVHFAGRRLRRDIARGAPVTRGDLVDAVAARRRVGARVAIGGRSVTLRVDWVGGSGAWVRAGDVVDVAVVLRSKGRRPRRLRMLMQAARVLAAERWVTRGALKARRPWCTLLALPREAHALSLAQRLGNLVLFGRNARDKRRAVYPPVTRSELESRRFWRDLRKHRLRTLKRLGLPDDPGFGPGLAPK